MERKNLELVINNSSIKRKTRVPTSGGPVEYDEPRRKIKDAISTGVLTGGILSILTYAGTYTDYDSQLLRLAIPSIVGILTGLGFGYNAYNDKHDGGGFL